MFKCQLISKTTLKKYIIIMFYTIYDECMTFMFLVDEFQEAVKASGDGEKLEKTKSRRKSSDNKRKSTEYKSQDSKSRSKVTVNKFTFSEYPCCTMHLCRDLTCRGFDLCFKYFTHFNSCKILIMYVHAIM